MKKTRAQTSGRVLLIGPSIDLPPAKRLRWLKAIVRKLRVGPSDLCIGVDGGIVLCEKLALQPQIAAGDWDSATRASLRRLEKKGTLILSLHRKKDWSDLSYALRVAQTFAPERIILLGFTGGRPDHQLSNLFEISRAEFPRAIAIAPEGEYHFLAARFRRPLEIQCPVGTLLSVFALGGPARGVRMKGFEYCLQNEVLEPSSRGLSNVTRSSRPEIHLRQGALVVMVPRE